MANRTSLRMRVLPRFPARISADAGLKIVQENVDLVVKPDFGALGSVPAIANADTTFFWGWDQSIDTYSRISFQNLITNIQSVIIGPTTAAMELTTPTTDQIIYFTGTDTAAVTGLTAAGRAIIDDPTAAAQRATLGLGTAALSATGDFATAAQGVKANSAVQPNAALVAALEAIVSLLPTTLPATSGKLWNNGGLWSIS